MTTPRRHLPAELTSALDALRTEMEVPSAFPPAVLAAADDAARRGPRQADRVDATDVPLVTIDPPTSRDLDQAVHVTVLPGGRSRIRYAIADVAAFVSPGDPIDDEAWARGVSRYSPDLITPLHPPAISEDAASLLPGEERPAVLWTLTLDADGTGSDVDVRRAMVRSRAKLSYAQAQDAIDRGTDDMLSALSRVGRLRAEREWVRGGVSLELPEQEVATTAGGGVTLVHRAPLRIESWNAQISLMTGMAAGGMMATAGVGVLRTLPAPDPGAVQSLRQRARALGLPWPDEVDYAAFVRTLHPHDPTRAAMTVLAARGLRGAGYAAFTDGPPAEHRHEAIAAVYAHVTAPLRRLVDRYATEVVLAVSTGQEPPEWVLARLADLPKAMGRARGRAGSLDRAVVDLVEAHVMSAHIGQVFPGTVVRVTDRGSDVQLRQPAVSTRVAEALDVGSEVHVRVDAVDVPARTVTLSRSAGPVA